MPIRILHFVDTFAVGGLQNGLSNLIEHMDAAHFEQILCAMRPVEERNAQHFLQGKARFMCLSKEDALARFQVPALAHIIREVRPDIVHTRNWGTFEALVAARWVGACGRVHSEHGLDWDTTSREPSRRVIFRRLAFEIAHRALAVSDQLRELHARRTGFPARKITVIHNGVDSRRFFPDVEARARARRELGLSSDEFCMGCIGSLIPVKDHLTLLKAIDEFAKRHQQWRLLIVGDGPELPQLNGFVNDHTWKDRVLFLGRRRCVAELLNAMDVYVLSSLTEGISNALLEAMATGLPVAVTATGGNPEVVVTEQSGLLFPVGDVRLLSEQLLRLEAQRALRMELGQGALRRVRDGFSLDSMVRKYEELYESLGSRDAVQECAAARA